jgi:LmbE family N-acetylglucosaminyl deacetylase
MRHFFTIILIAVFDTIVFAQPPVQKTSGEIYEALERFNFLGNALFVAAHPDDENTRLISYLVNKVNAHTTYLSLTRGDGGQNLIGPEISELLGVIRTQELLAARRTDGGHQMFTRANDFGYSKSPKEAISIWDDKQVKHDVVWAIRKLRPDVIINRFDHSRNRRTHGHHTASAMLSHELFEAAGDENAYPEQLEYVKTWKPERLFFNTSWWFYGSREKFAEADKSDMLSVDVGTYYPLLGKSNNEIAAESRSNHKCQGFGSTGKRGSQLEYVKLLKGSMPADRGDIFSGINTTWTRVAGGAAIQEIMNRVMKDFDIAKPYLSVPDLMMVYQKLDEIKDPFWKERKQGELEEIISSCLGLYIEAVANTASLTPGESIKIDIEATKRLPGEVELKRISIQPGGKAFVVQVNLEDNTAYYQDFQYIVPEDAGFTAPYWLEQEGSLGMYKVDDPELIGLPETPRPVQVVFEFEINNKPVSISKDLVYKYNSPEDGEVFQPFEITPELFVSVDNKVNVFTNQQTRNFRVMVKSGASNQSGKVYLPLPEGWTSEPEFFEFNLDLKGESQAFDFKISPPAEPSDIQVNPVVSANGKDYTKQLIEIDYDHIPLQSVLMPSKARLVNIDIKKEGQKVAYIMGAGDDIPRSIRNIGYSVDELELSEVTPEKLKKYDALIIGVRAYNTLDDIIFSQKDFMAYVEAGGTMIVQYNTTRGLKVDEIGPYPLKISRDRVSVEEAPITILAPDHPVMNYPNKITKEDFEGWVQERGLYFPNEWSEEYTPILSCHDPGEEPKNGGLLVAPYGRGYYIYTGYSWFRELPAGVPGAYRIFANLISLGNGAKP